MSRSVAWDTYEGQATYFSEAPKRGRRRNRAERWQSSWCEQGSGASPTSGEQSVEGGEDTEVIGTASFK